LREKDWGEELGRSQGQKENWREGEKTG